MQRLIFGVCGWWYWLKDGPTPENKREHSFSAGVGGGGGQRKTQPPKTSMAAHFRCVWVVIEGPTIENKWLHSFSGVWVVVVARGPEESPTPENEQLLAVACFWGGGGQRKAQPPKTSGYTRFWGLWVVMKPNTRKQVFMLVFERCGWWWGPEEGSTPKNERNGPFSGG